MDARIDNFNTWIKGSNSENLKTKIEKIIFDAGFTILDSLEHHYEPFGYTALWLLAESHCALHTFPEEGKTYIELSSCNSLMYDNFLVIFKDSFIETL